MEMVKTIGVVGAVRDAKMVKMVNYVGREIAIRMENSVETVENVKVVDSMECVRIVDSLRGVRVEFGDLHLQMAVDRRAPPTHPCPGIDLRRFARSRRSK